MASILSSHGTALPISVSTSQTPNKLVFTIDRDVQFNTIIRDGQHVSQPSQASNIVNTIEKDGKIISTVDRHGNAVAMCTKESLTFLLANFIKFSDTTTNGCFGGNGRFAEPLEPNTITKKRVSAKLVKPTTFYYFDSLPQEIKNMILNEVVEPHTVTVYQCRGNNVVNIDRKWTDIVLYHVCREFRQHAIKKFGVPKQHRSFPFDPDNDTLYLRESTIQCLAQLHRRGGRKRPVFQIGHWMSRVKGFIDPEIWDRIQTVESEARVPKKARSRVPVGIPPMFRNIKTWRILVIQLDTCKDADNPGTQPLFQKSDHGILYVIDCLSSCSEIYWKPKLIEVCRRGRMCSKPNKL